ncbi:MAG: KdsC family phosphatase [Lacipirellulaceae bacterium]
MSLAETCRRIRVVLSDVDGVMTDGSLSFDERGAEVKTFHVRDGLGIKLWQRAGGVFGIVTGRDTVVVDHRAKELGIEHVRQGVSEKLPVVRELAQVLGVTLDQIAYLGDDLPDAESIAAVGLGIAVADAVDEARHAARLVTKERGGRGAVREAIETILRLSGRWPVSSSANP